jgi:hypothetical protein
MSNNRIAWEVAVLRVTSLVVGIVLSMSLVACGGTGGSGSFNYSGSWAGSIQDSIAGTGSVTASMTQSGSNLVGTWAATFVDGNNGGSLVGIINSNSVVIELHPSNPSLCPYNVVANRSGSTLSGNYAAFDCTVTVTGTLNIQKQ